jgi:hypothetical protein
MIDPCPVALRSLHAPCAGPKPTSGPAASAARSTPSVRTVSFFLIIGPPIAAGIFLRAARFVEVGREFWRTLGPHSWRPSRSRWSGWSSPSTSSGTSRACSDAASPARALNPRPRRRRRHRARRSEAAARSEQTALSGLGAVAHLEDAKPPLCDWESTLSARTPQFGDWESPVRPESRRTGRNPGRFVA